MSVTIYVQDWQLQPATKQRVYMKDLYPNLIPEDFPVIRYPRDEYGHVYDEVIVYSDAFPEINMSNAAWADLVPALGISGNELQPDEQHDVIRNCCFLINSKRRISKVIRPTHIERNFYYYGTSFDEVLRRVTQLMNLLRFANDMNKVVYWC